MNFNDNRPQFLGWAPGNYQNKCLTCEREFIGDKRATSCAECAYKHLPEGYVSPPKDKPMTMDTAVDYEQEIIKLKDRERELIDVIQMCFDDACSPSGKISKKTAIELMKHADRRA